MQLFDISAAILSIFFFLFFTQATAAIVAAEAVFPPHTLCLTRFWDHPPESD